MSCGGVARRDFPRTLAEVQRRFASEEACRAYVAAARWPGGYRCPRCSHREALDLPGRLLWRCRACEHDTSVTAGTVLHRTRTPLTQWVWVASLVATHPPGVSALQLQRQLGLARYETAWVMLHKLRRAMGREALRFGVDPPLDQLAPLGEDADLAFLRVDVQANMVHGWPLLLRR